VIVVGGCAIWLNEKAEEGRRQLASHDASAVIACRDFRDAMRDLNAGILTGAELRLRVQAVYENARLADATVAPGVSDGARVLLAAITSGNTEQASAARDALLKACSLPGANRRQ
jgi:hypothetical protein